MNRPLDKAAEKPSVEKSRRRFKRATTLFSGTIICGDRSVEAVVLDVSVNGAKVRLEETLGEDNNVKLKIDRLGEFRAVVVWRKDMRIGLKFLEPPDEIARLMPEQFASKLSGASGD